MSTPPSQHAGHRRVSAAKDSSRSSLPFASRICHLTRNAKDRHDCRVYSWVRAILERLPALRAGSGRIAHAEDGMNRRIDCETGTRPAASNLSRPLFQFSQPMP
jgi:hypothetical protein